MTLNSAQRRMEAEISGKWLRKFRVEAGLSQTALANACGITAQTIGQYERGINLPMSSTQKRLAAALGCERDDIWA